MARRQINNIARLTQEQRFRVCQLLCDGATYEDINAEMQEMGVDLKLHGTSFKAYQESAEYQKYSERLLSYRTETFSRSMTAHISAQGMPETQTLIEGDLLEIIRGMLPGIEDARTTKTIASALKDLADLRKSKEVARLEAKILEIQNAHAEEVADYQAKVAELSAKIVELTTISAKDKTLSPEKLKEIRKVYGINEEVTNGK